jgi:alkylation response protein AidB-like acyl-CoA dehydrogenase
MSDTDGLAPWRDEVRAFVDETILPLERAFLAEGFAAVSEELDVVRKEVKRRGWWAPAVQRELGGMGLDLVSYARLAAILGRSPLANYAFHAQAPDAGTIEILHQHATELQRERWLEPLANGTFRSCFAMTEPGRAGSNPVWMDTVAERDGDHWVLNGHKWFTSSADGAELALVIAVTDPEAPPHRRASMFVVATWTPGWVLVRNLPVMGPADTGWPSHGEVKLESMRVSDEALVGERGAGFAMAQGRLAHGRIHHCARWIGVAERAFDMMCEYALAREVAPGEVLASKDLVRSKIARCRAELDAASLLVLDVAEQIERDGAKAARAGISIVKFHVARVLQQVLDDAIQVHGGAGLLDDSVLPWFWRHERAARIYDGPDEVHEIAAAKAILRRYQPATP